MSSEQPSEHRDPSDASWLRLLLLGIAALVCAGLLIAAVVIGVIAILD